MRSHSEAWWTGAMLEGRGALRVCDIERIAGRRKESCGPALEFQPSRVWGFDRVSSNLRGFPVSSGRQESGNGDVIHINCFFTLLNIHIFNSIVTDRGCEMWGAGRVRLGCVVNLGLRARFRANSFAKLPALMCFLDAEADQIVSTITPFSDFEKSGLKMGFDQLQGPEKAHQSWKLA